MNWGYKIILVFAVFVSGILYLVIGSFSQNIDLVTTNYYEEELKYQTTIDATERSNALSSKIICVVKNDTMHIEFPAEMKKQHVKADVWLYFIADKKKDIKQTFETSEGSISLPLTVMNKGLHDVKINWEAAGGQYYFEQKIFLQ